MSHIVSSFNINIDVSVELRLKMPSMGSHYLALVNFEHAMCVIGYMHSYDGGITANFTYQSSHGIRESKGGLQYFDHHMNSWKMFEEEAQEQYAQYLLEKEIK